MNPESINQRIANFQKRFGEAHLYFAYHAAFPLALTPDLAYRLWTNFQRNKDGNLLQSKRGRILQIPWIAVADLLLSNLCKEVAYELYEMEQPIRNELLKRLRQDERFGKTRLHQLAKFIEVYFEQQLHSDDLYLRSFANAQKWVTLAYTDPNQIVTNLATQLASKVKQEDKAGIIRVSSLLETVAEPLLDAGLEPFIVYFRNMGKFAGGDEEGARVYVQEFLPENQRLEVAGIPLPIPEELRKDKAEEGISEILSPKRTDKDDKELKLDDQTVEGHDQPFAKGSSTEGIRFWENVMGELRAYHQTLEISKRVSGTDHPDYIKSLDNLAGAYSALGEYGKAKSLYHQALEICERVSGTDHPDYIKSLGNLAGAYMALGKYGNAESLYHQALEICKRVAGTEHPSYVMLLRNLTEVYVSMEEYDKAEPLLRQILKNTERALGTVHPDYVSSLDNLARVYTALGEYDKAEPVLRQTLEIERQSLGTEHPSYANSLNNIAEVYRLTGEHDKAEPLYYQALEIKKQVLGADHIEYAVTLSNLAFLEISLERFKDALDHALTASRIYDRIITQIFPIGDKKRLQDYIKTFQGNYLVLLSIFAQHYGELQEYTPLVFDVILKHKLFPLEVNAIQRDNLLAHKNPQLKIKFEALKRNRINLSHLILEEGPKQNLLEHYQQEIQTLEYQIEILERELAAQVPQVALQKKLEHVEYHAIASLLPKDTSLIEFVWYLPVDFKQMRILSPRYLAFFLSPYAKEKIQVMDLGEASEIDSLIKQYRYEIIGEERRNIIAERYKHIVIGSRQNKLYEKLFQPIIDRIGDTKKLILAPDRNIALLPFEVLPQPNGRYVIEDFEILYVNSGRDLLRFQYHDEPQSHPLILTDPDFDLTGSASLSDTSYIAEKSFSELEKMSKGHNDNVYYFPRLQGIQEEGKQICEFFGENVEMWGQEYVLDQNVKRIQGPQILHIATHGFFLPEQEDDVQKIVRSVCMLGSFGMQGMFCGKQFENPLLRSILVLAGANTFFQGFPSAKGAEDGLLTALDVTGMDLIGTDLVVLSTEGGYGFQPAFTIAGARTLVLGLWGEVPDEETKELMIRFYGELLYHGRTKAEALRYAQLKTLNARRAQNKSDSPFYWGAFVCVGDPGKIGELCTRELKLSTVAIVPHEPEESGELEALLKDKFIQKSMKYKEQDFATKEAEAFRKTKETALLVIMWIDMVSSTKLRQELDEVRFQNLVQEKKRELTSIIERDNQGKIIKNLGDGYLAVFSLPGIAVERALEIQETFSSDPEYQLRIGLDMGQITQETEDGIVKDIFGRHVNKAARIEALCEGGHILTSYTVWYSTTGRLKHLDHIVWKKHGSYWLKGISEPQEVYEPYNKNLTEPLTELNGRKVNLEDEQMYCKLCGRYVKPTDTFKCRTCGKEGICTEHCFDSERRQCVECSSKEHPPGTEATPDALKLIELHNPNSTFTIRVWTEYNQKKESTR